MQWFNVTIYHKLVQSQKISLYTSREEPEIVHFFFLKIDLWLEYVLGGKLLHAKICMLPNSVHTKFLFF